MSKTVVTHISPDLDAVTSSWLIKRFMPNWSDAQMQFVPAGKTLGDKDPDVDPDIIHVDTGLGKFDHHQFEDPDKKHCATERVFSYLLEENVLKPQEAEALSRMVRFVTATDHFGEIYLPDPLSDVYDFGLHQVLEGFKLTGQKDQETCEIGFKCLDAIFQIFKQKVAAEEDIKKGYIFQCKWGQALAMETRNEESLKIALKSGYRVVTKKNPDQGNIRIKSHPVKDIDLTPLYEKVKKLDPKATWYFHPSKHMLLNSSAKRPDSVPSSLPLKKVIEIIKSIT